MPQEFGHSEQCCVKKSCTINTLCFVVAQNEIIFFLAFFVLLLTFYEEEVFSYPPVGRYDFFLCFIVF